MNFSVFRKYLQCDYDLLQFMSIEDFLWVQHHLIVPENFYTKEQMPVLERCLALMSDARKDLNKGLVMNLVKSIYAMREVRANLVEEALPDTIEFMLVQIENILRVRNKSHLQVLRGQQGIYFERCRYFSVRTEFILGLRL